MNWMRFKNIITINGQAPVTTSLRVGKPNITFIRLCGTGNAGNSKTGKHALVAKVSDHPP
jgi:hypothetical protein